MSTRIDKISEEVMRALAESIRKVKDPRVSGLVSITRCDVTGDLHYCKVYVSVLGTPEEQKDTLKGLKSAAGFLRREVSSKVLLRHMPELIFTLDESIVRGAHINDILSHLPDVQGETERDADAENADD